MLHTIAFWSALVGIFWLYAKFWPKMKCRWCGGSGKWLAPFSSRRFRNCWWCGGSGRSR